MAYYKILIENLKREQMEIKEFLHKFPSKIV